MDLPDYPDLEVLNLQYNKLAAPPDVAHNPDLEVLYLDGNQLAAPPDVAHNPRLKELYLHDTRLVAPPDLAQIAYPHLTKLFLSNNRLTTLPDVRRCTGLEYLNLHDNALDCEWYTHALPATLTSLHIGNNPKLWGVLTKALVAQCTGALTYSGCRRRDQCSAEEKRQLKYLQTPFFVGLTVASEDIEDIVLRHIGQLKIGLENMIDAPARGDASLDMCKTHGKAWTAWQEVSIFPNHASPGAPRAHAAYVFWAAACGLPAQTPAACHAPVSRMGVRRAKLTSAAAQPVARCATPRPACPSHQPACTTPVRRRCVLCCCCCPLQVWLKGLLALARGTTIWAIATQGNFKRKLLGTDRWATDEQCRAACFDPCYRLPEGTRATSILDWEAKQFAIAQEQNGLVVKRFTGYSEGVGEVADWYPVPHTATGYHAEDV